MSDSFIESAGGAVSFVGSDAVALYRAMTIRHALRLLQVGIKPTRGVSMTRALRLVQAYSGRTYKRTESSQAIADLSVWIANMQSALPVKTDGKV